MIRKFLTLTFLFNLIFFSALAQGPGGLDFNLNLWLKADTGLEVSAGNPAVSGNTIQFWRDMGPQGNDALMNVAGNRPSFNGEAVVFTGAAGASTSGQYFDIPSMSLQSVFVVLDNTQLGASGGFHSIASQDHTGSSVYLFLNNQSTGFTVSFDGTINVTGRFGLNGAAFSAAGEDVGSANFPSERTLFTGEYTNSQPNMIYLAALDNGPGPRYRPNFHMLELAFFDTSFTSVERCRIESYLCLKHGVEKTASDNAGTGIDERDYLASDSTVIWDYSVDSAYSFDVAGIGRDDSSALDLRAGSSRSSDASVVMEKTSAFSSNGQFLVWGNNNGSRTINNAAGPAGYDGLLQRTWRVNLTGTPGNVELKFVLSRLGFNTLVANQYALLIKNNDDFSSGFSIDTTASLSGDTLIFSNVSFTDGDYFTLAGPEASSPGGVSAGLNLWLKHEVGVEEAAGNPAEAGDLVAFWRDQSGQGNDASQTLSAARPLYRPGYLAFRGSAGNNTNGDYFDIPEMNVQSIIAVVDSLRDGVSGGIHGISGNVASGTRQYLFFDTQNSYVMSFDGTGSFTGRYGLNGAAFSATGQNVGSGDFPSDDAIAYCEYTAQQSNWRFVGGFSSGSNVVYRPNLNWKELLFYDASFSSVERARIESYLHVKYDITRNASDIGATAIDERDYLASDSTVIWDFTANASFNAMIAGLGRDDLSALYDTIGNSVEGDIVSIERRDSVFNDKNFFVYGHNNEAPNSWRVTDLPAGIQGRIARVWKAQETGDIDTLHLLFDLSEVYGPGGNGNNDLQFVRLLIDADGDFSAGATVLNSSTFNNTTDIVEFDFDFNATDGYFLSLGSTDTSNAPLNLNALKLTANASERGVLLQWEALNPMPSDLAYLRHSSDLQRFDTLGVLFGEALEKSRFLHLTPANGNNYYHIHSPQFSSNMEVVLWKSQFEQRVYPNLLGSNDLVNIVCGDEASTLSWNLISAQGSRIARGEIPNCNGETHTIDLAAYQLKAGLYFLEIWKNAELSRHKLMIK